MKNYQIIIRSFKDPNVVRTEYFATKLQKEVLMDILSPLTKYSISIEEIKEYTKLALSMEGLLSLIIDLKLKTKVAKNVLEVKEGVIGIFPNKPELTLNIWHGDCGETRTYINNVYFSEINKIFPKVFKQDPKNKYPYFEGALFLDYVDEIWKLHSVKSEFKVVYEEVILES